MGTYNLLLLLGMAYLLFLIDVGEATFADLSCYPKYIKDATDPARGQGLIDAIDAKCKEQTEECFKMCVLREYRISEDEGTRLNEDWGFYHFSWGVFDESVNKDLLQALAIKIYEKCYVLGRRAKNIPCEARTELYDCVEKAMVCDNDEIAKFYKYKSQS